MTGTFEQRVLDALDTYAGEINEESLRGRLSVSAFLKRYGISRSSLYENHAHLVAIIETRLDSATQLPVDHPKSFATSVHGLQKQLADERRKHRAEIEKLASGQMVYRLKEDGPALREKRHLVMEIQEMKRQIEASYVIISNFQAMVQFLLMQSGGQSEKLSDTSSHREI